MIGSPHASRSICGINTMRHVLAVVFLVMMVGRWVMRGISRLENSRRKRWRMGLMLMMSGLWGMLLLQISMDEDDEGTWETHQRRGGGESGN